MKSIDNGTVLPPPEWHPHDDPNYDLILSPASASELTCLRSGTTSDRLEFIVDPREAHRRLYAQLAPPTHPEYAGTFRGAVGTTLVARDLIAPRITEEKVTQFCQASKVEETLSQLRNIAEKLFKKSESESPQTFLTEAARIFYLFGLIHPFLDGNGHIQRLIFAACIFEHPDLELLPNWTIHPRPYDNEMALAFEKTGDTAARVKAVRSELSVYVTVPGIVTD